MLTFLHFHCTTSSFSLCGIYTSQLSDGGILGSIGDCFLFCKAPLRLFMALLTLYMIFTVKYNSKTLVGVPIVT